MLYKSNNLKRIVFPQYLTQVNLMGKGAEIGVWSGWHASLILNNWKGEMIYAVDPWNNLIDDDWKKRYTRAVHVLSRHKNRCTILKTDSLSASKEIEDDTLDWVYIDGRHDFAGVTEDIVAWTPKVRKGGVIAGHDYQNTIKTVWPDVKRAVDKQFKGVQTWPDAQTWYVIKT